MYTNRKMRWASTLAVGAAASLVLAGCAPAEQEPTDEPVTLTVQQQAGEDQERLFAFLKEEFEALYPNVTVEIQFVSAEQKNTSNIAVLGSANPPDVGIVPLNSEAYTQLLNANALAPLDDLWETSQLQERYGDAVADALTATGSPYAVAYLSVIYNVVWFNPDLFVQAGIDVPADRRIASVDDLVDMAEKLRAIGVGPLQIGGTSGYQPSWMIDAMLPTAVPAEDVTNFLSSYDPATDITANFTDPGFVTVLETLKEMADKGVFQDGFLGQDAATSLAPFLQGQAGMALGGNFTQFDFESNELGFTPDWMLLPPVDGGTQVVQTLYFGDALGIPAKSDNIEWAKRFLEFLMSDDIMERGIIGEMGNLPPVNSLPAEAYDALSEATKQLLQDGAEFGSQPGWTATVPGGYGQQHIEPLLQRMFAGELTPAEVAESQQQRLIDYRAELEANQ